MRSVLHNVTIYVKPEWLGAMRDFYGNLVGSDPVFEDPGRIVCFGTTEMAICIHAEEPGHPAASTELFFWSNESQEVQLSDPIGHQVRLQPRQ